MPVVALYEFNDAGNRVLDSAPGHGAQDGACFNGASAVGGQAVLDGVNDFVKIYCDPAFQMDRGTLEIRFTLSKTPQHGTQTVVSRDTNGTEEGSYRIEITNDNSIVVSHETDCGRTEFSTDPCFVNPGDQVSLTYSWDQGGAGGVVSINNLTTGACFAEDVPGDLTMDMGALNQPWILGAGQNSLKPAILHPLDRHFAGSVEKFSLSDTVDNLAGRDGIVSGSPGDDLINLVYTGDPDGDRVDNKDAILPGDAPNDDRILAGGGNDKVWADAGNDQVDGGSGDDAIDGGAGNDSLFGGVGRDRMDGGCGDDMLTGGSGNDTITGGQGADTLAGGADRDVFIRADAGDAIDGNENGDDFDTLDLTGAGPLRITLDPANAENGMVSFLNADREVTGTLSFVNIENVIPCFTPGTMIATPRGEVPVERLRVGDRVITRDNGLQEIRWIGSRALTWPDLNAAPHLKPVLVRQGSLGNGLPERDMMVSPNHRLLVANDRTALHFDEHEVLVAAKHLISGQGVRVVDSMGTMYIHFMCDRHEVVLSNGAWTESFQPGDLTLKGMGNAQRSEIFDLFPELKTDAGLEGYAAARRTLRRHEAVLLTR